MKRFFGQPERPSGEEIYNATYENNRWTKEEALRSPLTIEEVLGTQAVVMQLLRERSRSVVRGNKRHGFAALNSIETEDFEYYDGSREEYLTCRVAKVAYDQWRMHIVFRENQISKEHNLQSYVDDYTFDWLRNGNLQAWAATYSVNASAGRHHQEWHDIDPLTSDENERLRDRLRQHSKLAAMSIEKSLGAGRIPRALGPLS